MISPVRECVVCVLVYFLLSGPPSTCCSYSGYSCCCHTNTTDCVCAGHTFSNLGLTNSEHLLICLWVGTHRPTGPTNTTCHQQADHSTSQQIKFQQDSNILMSCPTSTTSKSLDRFTHVCPSLYTHRHWNITATNSIHSNSLQLPS